MLETEKQLLFSTFYHEIFIMFGLFFCKNVYITCYYTTDYYAGKKSFQNGNTTYCYNFRCLKKNEFHFSETVMIFWNLEKKQQVFGV